ncbi:flavodoxin short chain [Anaerospora hongkongensis]|uniref:Flavodoxin short chain n=1 Tax=Anaerospora hongkongensis TaxID=244830 RepID=A0A4R1Q140_9FIRM|nr:flavodoxin short chain [Anaerospora hongkongensis]
MSKITVIYWSGSGNTEAMAEAVVEGAKAQGAEVRLLHVGEADKDTVAHADALAIGCPSMGAEVLEEAEMEPFISSIESVVAGKPIALFSVLTAGVTENGCRTGLPECKAAVPRW